MTTPNEELRKLAEAAIPAMVYEREYKTFEKSITPECVIALLDQMQSQAERIKELEGDVEYLQNDIDAMCNAIPSYRWSGGAAELIAKCFAERDTLRAELDAIEAQEPVAWMTPSGEGYMIRFTEPMTEVNMGWDKLYAAPAAQQPAKQAQPGRAPLSDEQVMVLGNSLSDSECSLQWDMWPVFARAIEAAHGIKQGGQHD